MSCVSNVFASVHCCLLVIYWERADRCLLYFVTFPCGILGQVWYLILSFPFFSFITFTVCIFMFLFSKLSSMLTALCGIVLFCLLTIIHDDNMKTDASLIKKFETMLKHRKEMVLARCCARNCLKGDICKAKLGGRKGCRCFRHDKSYAGGGRWLFFP